MAIRRLSSAGITAGGKSSKVWDQETTPGNYEAIATAVSDYGAVFTNLDKLPYTHLQIRVTARDTAISQTTDLNIRFNNDTGSTNYRWHRILGQGVSTGQADAYNTSYLGCAVIPAASATASVYGSAIIDILDYKSTSKVKVVRSIGGFDANGSGYIGLNSGMWVGSASTQVTQIEVYAGSGVAVANNHFALYGLRG